uniref:Uncharacterized protein n=1 Tax=Fagus sylvatica TaxID=28930 RepID=A0A2N9F5R5_FAGSY
MDVMNQQVVNLRRSFAAFEMNNSGLWECFYSSLPKTQLPLVSTMYLAFVVDAADCNFVGSQGSMDLGSVNFPINSQTEKRGAVMLEYDLMDYAKSYDLLMNEVYHSNACSKM